VVEKEVVPRERVCLDKDTATGARNRSHPSPEEIVAWTGGAALLRSTCGHLPLLVEELP
jgi:hypothetical protein